MTAIFVELLDGAGVTFFINVNHIESIEEYCSKSQVNLTSGKRLLVRESPSRIFEKIAEVDVPQSGAIKLPWTEIEVEE